MKLAGAKTFAGALLAVCLLCPGSARVAIAQKSEEPKLISGRVYRVHSGFLEVQSDPKNIAIVKVNAATIYWNGKTDKKASAKELRAGDEVVIDAAGKDGLTIALKVRFMRAAN